VSSREAAATAAQPPARARGGRHRTAKDTGRSPGEDSTHGCAAGPTSEAPRWPHSLMHVVDADGLTTPTPTSCCSGSRR